MLTLPDLTRFYYPLAPQPRGRLEITVTTPISGDEGFHCEYNMQVVYCGTGFWIQYVVQSEDYPCDGIAWRQLGDANTLNITRHQREHVRLSSSDDDVK